jgi:hypothetical protein
MGLLEKAHADKAPVSNLQFYVQVYTCYTYCVLRIPKWKN